MQESARSYEKIEVDDLRAFAKVALARLEAIYANAPVAGIYRDKLLLLALCQGGGQHFLLPDHGLKDVDVWAFYRNGPAKPFPFRTVWNGDLGSGKFGRHPDDVGFIGRRVDIIGRSIDCAEGETAQDAVKRWLTSGRRSAVCLSQRPVIAIAPESLCGEVVWEGKNDPDDI